jgi:hypothetical protein
MFDVPSSELGSLDMVGGDFLLKCKKLSIVFLLPTKLARNSSVLKCIPHNHTDEIILT